VENLKSIALFLTYILLLSLTIPILNTGTSDNSVKLYASGSKTVDIDTDWTELHPDEVFNITMDANNPSAYIWLKISETGVYIFEFSGNFFLRISSAFFENIKVLGR